jgi:hypothetical protein
VAFALSENQHVWVVLGRMQAMINTFLEEDVPVEIPEHYEGD